jgi:hypothetical protein
MTVEEAFGAIGVISDELWDLAAAGYAGHTKRLSVKINTFV